jgi:hypothetical protein
MDFAFPRFAHEYALAFLVALPVLVVVAINVALAWSGERDTLLLPGLHPYAVVVMPAESSAVAAREVEKALEVAASLAPTRREARIERRVASRDRRIAVHA